MRGSTRRKGNQIVIKTGYKIIEEYLQRMKEKHLLARF